MIVILQRKDPVAFDGRDVMRKCEMILTLSRPGQVLSLWQRRDCVFLVPIRTLFHLSAMLFPFDIVLHVHGWSPLMLQVYPLMVICLDYWMAYLTQIIGIGEMVVWLRGNIWRSVKYRGPYDKQQAPHVDLL